MHKRWLTPFCPPGKPLPRQADYAAMSRLHNLSIGAKLYCSFGLLAALILISGLIALRGASSQRSAARSIVHIAATSSAAAQARFDAADMNGWQTAYGYEWQHDRDSGTAGSKTVDELASRKAFLAAVGHLRADISRLSNDPLTAANARALSSQLDAFMQADQRIMSALELRSHAGDAIATQLILGREIQLYNALANNLVKLERSLQTTAANGANHAGSTASQTTEFELATVIVALIAAVGIAWTITRTIKADVAPVLDRLRMLREHCATDLRAGLEALAGGDLTRRVTPVTPLIPNPGKDEIGRIATEVNAIRESTVASVEAFNSSCEELAKVVGDLTMQASNISAASEEMASNSDETGRTVSEIAAAIGEVAAGAERQARMVEQTRTNTDATRNSAQGAREVAGQGAGAADEAAQAMVSVNESASQVTEAIRALSTKSDQIGGIVGTITGLADQTNLLALNAAIEAARAGEQGRGFAVVAEEVRKLAEQSQAASTTIAGLITEIQTDTEQVVGVVAEAARRTELGTEVVERAREAFGAIDSAVQEFDNQIGEIAQATSEVATVAEQASASTQQIYASTQQTSVGSEQLSRAAEDLAVTAGRLEELVSQFRLA